MALDSELNINITESLLKTMGDTLESMKNADEQVEDSLGHQ